MATLLNRRPFDLQGHRGARGLAPENSLLAFARALSIGVTTLELDTAVTRDGVVVVAHDRRLNPDITRDRHGAWIRPPTPTVRSLSFAELKEFDVGRIDPASNYQRRFPGQAGEDGVAMPALEEVFALVHRLNNTSVRFNIETKLSPLHPDEAPSPEDFVDALLGTIRAAHVLDRVTIQSFDWRTLHLARMREPDISISFLSTQQVPGATIAAGMESPWTDGMRFSDHGSVPRMIASAAKAFGSNRQGVIWSPHFADVTEALVKEAHALQISVLPWTLNEPAEFVRAIALGVDGLITDYPDRARAILGPLGITLPE
jgi:glycerophosphoryl diester phosphodiesterase